MRPDRGGRQPVRVFVTGGTGAIGSYTVPALLAAGHTVSALVRNETKARTVQNQGATPVKVSLFDRHALAAAFTGHDAVVNLASALPSPRRFLLRSAWAQSMTRSLRVSNARFCSATNWKPQFPSAPEGYQAMANARS
ncbi:SDR family oxidoreductase [Mycobacterium colombiense]|uniref:SDR family oxidoreductase n=1 Tax=Mycobacterium colombiense TaxID=339268 RepID=UPI002F2657A6